jgi:hypothetical protein
MVVALPNSYSASALCSPRFISALMAFGAKQLDIFRLLASQGVLVQVVEF